MPGVVVTAVPGAFCGELPPVQHCRRDGGLYKQFPAAHLPWFE
jgi:hypothetical protein